MAFATVSAALPASAATTLVNVRVEQTANGGATVAVQFAGPVPKYRVLGAGSPEASIIFEDTQMSPQTPPTVAGVGSVASVSVVQNGTSSSIALHLASPLPVTVAARGTTLIVNVPAPSGNAATPGAPTAPAPQASGAGNLTEVVALKYADVSEIAGILVPGSNVTTNDTFQPVVTNLGSSSVGNGQYGGTFGGFQQTPQQPQTFGGFNQQQGGVGQRLNDNIAIDRRLNAVILTGTQDVIDQFKSVINKLDIPLQSVILETQIIELSENAARDVGIDFFPGGGAVLVNGSPSSTSTGGRSGGLIIGTQEQASAQISLQANLNAQITEGHGKVLAKPRILAQSGVAASILTGEAIPIFTSVVVTGSAALTSQQVNYINVGVNLQIQPRVSSDGFVTSHIYTEVSSVSQFISGTPQIAQRTANTIATVKDGDSFVIGGLLQDNEIKTLVKLPFIGDLPLIGTFFRHYTTTHDQTNLYIVVTPHVVGGNGNPPPATQVVQPPNVGVPVQPSGVPVASPAPSPGAQQPPIPKPTPHR